jgi:hypothetical protein
MRAVIIYRRPILLLITHSIDLAVCKVDLDHVLGGSDEADGGVGTGIEDFGSVTAVFVGRDITIIALYIEGQPM